MAYVQRCFVPIYLGGFSTIHMQKYKELCGRYDYSDGLLIDSTNVHKVPYLKRHFALFPVRVKNTDIDMIDRGWV